MSKKTVFTGLLIGGGLMYLFDPVNGKERRQQLRERISGVRSSVQERMGKGADEVEDAATEFSNGLDRATARRSADASRMRTTVAADARDSRDRAAEVLATTPAIPE